MDRPTARIAVALLAAALTAGLAQAEPPGPHRGPPPEDRQLHLIDAHAERLGLDDETRSRIRGVAETSFDRSQQLHSELRAAHDAMRGLLDQEEPDVDAVMAQADRIGGLETELRKQRLRSMLEIRGLLSAEQRAELVKIREELGPPGRGRFGRQGGPPGRPPRGGPPGDFGSSAEAFQPPSGDR